jgi:Tfp pilus assembly protein PilN
MNLKRIYRLGTGCGMEIRGEDLVVIAVKSRPAGVSVLGQTRLEDFRQRPPREWGAEYAVFLKDLGLSHLSATVALPRQDMIVRQLLLPPVSGKELAAAVRYQLDALHPFGEDEVYHAFAPLREPGEGKGQLPVAVAIAEKSRIDGYVNLFEAAGIAVAAFTVADASLAAALRVRWDAPPRPFVFAQLREGSIEVYGEAEERPLWTAQFDLASLSPLKALQVTAAELRLDPALPAALVVCGDSARQAEPRADSPDGVDSDAPPAELPSNEIPAAFELRSVAELLPAPLAAPASFDIRREATAFAVALESACPRLGWRANLLPPEHRKSDSRWMYAPTAALAVALLLLAIAFAVRPLMQDRRYLAALESESARLEQIVRNVEQTEQQSGHARRRLLYLHNTQQRCEADLRVLRELSELVPNEFWLQSIEINDKGAQLVGLGPAAAPLLGVLSGSTNLADASFTSSLVKTDAGERFQIAANRRPPGDATQKASRAAVAPTAAPARPAAAQPQPAPGPGQSETLSTVGGDEPQAAGGRN